MEEKTLTIEKVVFGGKGLSRDLQQVTFVPFTLPGEKVRVSIRKQQRDYFLADPVEIIEPSPNRVPPACSYFGHCGGCQISHANYETQVQLKEAALQEVLQRNKLNVPRIEVIAGQPFGYRHRARFKYSAKKQAFGFYEMESHRIVDIKECLCLTPSLNALLKKLRIQLAAAPASSVEEIECYENDRGEIAVYFDAEPSAVLRSGLEHAGAQVFGPIETTQSKFAVHFRDYDMPMRPDIFLQVHPGMWNAMIQEVESHFNLDQERTILELYCGAGFFTVPLSRLVKKVVACEENAKAVNFAREHHSISNIEWHCVKAEDFAIPQEVTAAVVDPPRAGLPKAVIEKLLNHPLERITYVSCDAASFARDAKLLSAKFDMSRLAMLDLFPQTFHFEVIAQFRSNR